jgi:hypothetical protein
MMCIEQLNRMKPYFLQHKKITMTRFLKLLFILPFIGFLGMWLPTFAQSSTVAPDGIYVPRLNTAQRSAIANPSVGQLIYNTDDGCFNIYTQANVWQSLCAFDRLLTNTWTRKADLANGGRYRCVGFSIGSKGYIGLGVTNNTLEANDFWEYDPVTDAYTQKANFPDGGRRVAVGFSIANKGYVGTGQISVNTYKKDFWEYDPANNQWTQKADFGGTARILAVGFAIGNKGYIGTGEDSLGFTKDFWEYDPANNQWTQKADLGTADSTKRQDAFGMSIGSKGYIGGGLFNNAINGNKLIPNDFWEYNPANNQWTEKANIPTTLVVGPLKNIGAKAFSIFDKGYVGGGAISASASILVSARSTFQEYSPVTNQWTRLADFAGGPRHSGVGFSIANKGYVGFGYDNGTLSLFKNDLWSFGGFADVTQQGNSFNQANQLVKLDAFGNLAISGIIVSEPYLDAPFVTTNGWVNYGVPFATAAYYKDKSGIVHLKGTVKNGTQDIFILPVGYRPNSILVFDVISSSGLGRIDITVNGGVSFVSGGNGFVSLDGITFRAEQ